MAPGVGPLPAAAGPGPPDARRVDVVAALDRYLSPLPRATVTRIRIAVRAFDLLPFPRRFSRAGLAARERYLERLDAGAGPIGRDLLLALKVLCGVAYGSDPRVARALGYEAGCQVLEPARPATPRSAARGPAAPSARAPGAPLGELEPGDTVEECDVAIVGSGAGGAAAASVLAEAGLDVIVLEAGPYLDRRDYPREPIEALGRLYRDGGLTIAAGRPSIPIPVGRAVGGTTVINSGTCLRAPESVLAGWEREHGVDCPDGLEPEYAAAERMLAVTAVVPEHMGRNGELLREGAEALGVDHRPLLRNAGACVRCGTCPVGCRLDAKRAMHVSYLPRAVAAGARVRAGVEARRISFAGSRATGVECVSGVAGPTARARGRYRVRARRAVVLAGGAFGTPELLLRSGFRAGRGPLGRNLRVHPACWVGARFDEPVRGWEGVMQSYAVDEWRDRGLLLEATFTPLAFGGHWLPGAGREHQRRLLAFDRLASVGVHLSDRSSGRVRPGTDGAPRIRYRLGREDARRLVFGIARACELLFAAGAREVYPQIAGLPSIAPGAIAELEAGPPSPSALRLEAFHPMGTARIDRDPRRGVTGADGAVHGAEGLLVADASLLPSSIGVNPMLTIVAVATRIARGLAARTP